MADSNEASDETVRIDGLPESVSKPLGPDTKSRETVRIQLGLRQPSDKLPSRIPAEPSPVLEPAAQVLISPEIFPPLHLPSKLLRQSLFYQTPLRRARKTRQRASRACQTCPSKPLPSVQMKKTQPLIAMPHTAPQRASIAVAPAEKSATPLCWVLLGISVIILIIQIWTYLS